MVAKRMFVSDRRDDGTEFIRLSDDAPDWLRDAVYKSHDSDMPNDWIYSECAAAYDAAIEGTDPSDHADSQVDVYTREIFQWAADMCLSSTYSDAESEADELGGEGTIAERITRIQFCAIRRIAEIIGSAVDDNANE